MPTYRYKGRTKKGTHSEGEIDAINEDAAISALLQKEIIVTRIKDKAEELDFSDFLISAFGFGRPKLEDLLLFARQMHTMMKSGVPIIRSITVIATSTQNRRLREALEQISSSLEAGKSLAAAMQVQHLIFPSLIISMVHVGENTGNLDEAFRQIAIYVENEMDTRRRIKSAVRYPVFVILSVVVAIAIINIWVVPAFTQFFDKFGGELPWPTKLLIASSDFTLNYWPLLLLGIVGSIAAFLVYIRTEDGEIRWGKTLLKVPLIGKILEQALLARFCRSFAMTIGAGVPLLQALTVVAKAVDNAYIAQRVIGMRAGLERGESLVRTAAASEMFTPLVMQMMMIGEETGDVDGMLSQVADTYEGEVDYALRGLSEAIEPILISVIAVIVLILALGVFLPMWELSSVALNN